MPNREYEPLTRKPAPEQQHVHHQVVREGTLAHLTALSPAFFDSAIFSAS